MNLLPQRRRLLPGLLLLVVFLTGMTACYTAWRFSMADLQVMRARAQIATWLANPLARPAAQEIGRATNDLNAGMTWLPGDPEILEGLAHLYGRRALLASGVPELAQAMLEATLDNSRAALVKRPMSADAWANVALCLHLADREPQAMWAAFDRAARYGFREQRVQTSLLRIAFARWQEAGVQRREIAGRIFSESKGEARRRYDQLIREFDLPELGASR